MLKELVLAIIFGTILGFGLTGSAVGVKNLFQKDTKRPVITVPTAGPTQNISITLPSNTPAPTMTPNPSGIKGNSLTITKPDNDGVSATEDVTISGTGLPNSLILATTSSEKSQTLTNNTGDFTLKIKLDPGRNEIQVFSVTQEEELSSKLYITYSNARF